ncbi:MAG: hypothetical protein JOS17DRAFT_748346 [Linnemannia elongata]|nr:MAG: hypothetical protein JOS17DRAFT_748346 [Linnemannia elongata]
MDHACCLSSTTLIYLPSLSNVDTHTHTLSHTLSHNSMIALGACMVHSLLPMAPITISHSFFLFSVRFTFSFCSFLLPYSFIISIVPFPKPTFLFIPIEQSPS